VLIAGLGNRNLTADTVGPFAAEGVTMTRPIALSDPSLFEKLNHAETSVIIPCVMGETGIESAHLVKSAVKIVKPDLVIAVDALAARSPDRLLTTLQICDTGIAPGSGVGNGRASINRSTMGVPVIAIGVPTVVESRTLIYDAIAKAKSKALSQEIERILSEESSFFVSPKDSDVITENAAKIISSSINSAFNAELFL
jgi:spore protease